MQENKLLELLWWFGDADFYLSRTRSSLKYGSLEDVLFFFFFLRILQIWWWGLGRREVGGEDDRALSPIQFNVKCQKAFQNQIRKGKLA